MAAADAGAVRRAVQAPEGGHGLSHHRPQGVAVGDVGGDEARVRAALAQRRDHRGAGLGVDVGRQDARAVAAKSSAVARPIPDAAPVTSATLPCRP